MFQVNYVLLCFIVEDWHSIATGLFHFINEMYIFVIYRLNRLIYKIAERQQFLYCCTSNFNKPTCTRQGMKRHSPTTNLRIRYCKMVAKSESWSELSSDRDRESLSSILLEVEVPIQMKIFNTSYNVKPLMECTLLLLRRTNHFLEQSKKSRATHEFAFPNKNKQLYWWAPWVRLQILTWF